MNTYLLVAEFEEYPTPTPDMALSLDAVDITYRKAKLAGQVSFQNHDYSFSSHRAKYIDQVYP